MNHQLTISEVLNKVASANNRGIKIKILRENITPALRTILKYVFHPAYKFYTNKAPKYTPDHAPTGLSFSNLFSEHRKFYIYAHQSVERQITKGTVTSIPRKEQLLIQMLESIHPNESVVVEHMINGTFTKFTTIDKKLVDEALPGLLT